MVLPAERKKSGRKGRIVKIFAAAFLIFFLSSSFVFMAPRPARADLPVVDLIGNALKTGDTVWTKIQKVLGILLTKVAAVALQSAVSNTLNTIAYDEATYLGSGRQGQKPLWETGDTKTIMSNIGDQAAGQFISSLDKQFGVKLCQPNISAKLTIGLGMVGAVRPPAPDCTASTLIKNWDATIKTFTSSNRQDFLKQFAGIFDVTGGKSDLSASLSLQSDLINQQQQAQLNQALTLQASGFWNDPRNIAGTIKGVPGQGKTNAEQTALVKKQSLLQTTQDDLVNAAEIFIKQLSITGLQTIMKNLTSSLSQPAANSSITNPYAAPQSGGVANAQGILRQIVEPKFGSKTDYNILQELSVCNVGVLGGVGPTDCVIDPAFSQAVENRETVGQAVADGSLDGAKPFGFIAGSGTNSAPIEPVYTQGYPYRSMSILRKYRIIPVGWELAAQYIQAHFSEVGSHNNLKDLIACYDSNDSYTGYYADWCRGLIDPTWVLKAPQNYCAKQGFGPQILSGQSVSGGVDGNGNPLQSQFQVVRSDSYCGDEQSCIKENDDGSCKYFGYCTEDKRLWKFGSSNSCESQYNTCQTFTDSQGAQVSYLKDSLQLCDASEAGCKDYAIPAAEGYDADTGSLDWTKSSDSIFLNNGAKTCDPANEGCHEFLRFSSGLGANLIIDSNFAADAEGSAPAHWNFLGSAAVTSQGPAGRVGNVAEITGNAGGAELNSLDWSSNAASQGSTFISAFPQGFVMEPEISYTLSADVYLQGGDSVTIGIGRNGSAWQEAKVTAAGSWQTISITLLNNQDILANEIRIYGSGANANFYVSNIKFEVGGAPTAFTAYRDNNLIYEKFMPDYLKNACYADPANGDFRLIANAPAVCDNFARQCNRDEVNCDSYTNNDIAGQAPIPAAVTDVDACPAVCDGYNTYIQSANVFSTAHAKYFIPSTARTCASAAVGCQEFTNLASSTAGGERKEYYSYLRQCVKPTDAAASCGDFYTWQGSATQGQQLIKYSLQANGSEPAIAGGSDADACNVFIYNLNPANPAYNADCRQFYDKAGNISYHLYSRTITCSADCTSYRMTNKDIIDTADSETACDHQSGNWDDASQVCYSCQDGGTWDASIQACVYQALASESRACGAADNGCAEFNGNGGANSQTVSYDDFEGTGAAAWTGGAINNSSYVAGSHSFQFSSAISKNIGQDTVAPNGSYVLTFLAKTDNNSVELTAFLDNQTGGGVLPFDKSVIVKPGEWRLYSLNLPTVNRAITANETLTIKAVAAADQIYIDNIQLTKITDRFYLVAGSWKTPASCDEDTNGNPYPLFALGCASYDNHLGETKYLHNFDHICQPSAVGCEAMIDTENTDSPDADSSFGATTTVTADQVIYAVYDENKLCGKTDQGCSRLGQKSSYGAQATYQDAYLDNNPQQYSSILCSQGGVGCDVFNYTAGNSGQSSSVYFRDPGNQVCEWRQSPSVASNNGWGWYKKRVNRCGGIAGNPICAADKDCAAGSKCLAETTDTPCPVAKLLTIGTGGLGNEVYQPASDGVYQWAGLCPDAQSSCTEYIDPVSDFSSNVVANADFTQNIGGQEVADNWSGVVPNNYQNINLEGGTLYVLAVQGGSNSATLNTGVPGTTPFHVLRGDNTFAAPTGSIKVSSNQTALFYTDNTIKFIYVSDAKPNNNSKIILRRAVVNYQLADGVDKGSCTQGGANPSAGCVYFNERSVSGLAYQPLSDSFDPWSSYGASNMKGINSGAIDLANSLIKVNPDRDCAQWLACKTYVKDDNSNNNVCYDVANCNRLDDVGNCANFTVLTDEQKNNRVYPSDTAENTETIKNLTGYVRVGYPTVNAFADLRLIPNDLLNLGAMSQIGKNVVIPNGDFELAVSTSSPINGGVNWIGNPANWSPVGAGKKWTPDTADSLYSVISDPETAQNFGFYADRKKSADTYPMIGKSFLRYNATAPANGQSDNFPESSVIYVQAGQDYYLSFYLDTFGLKGSGDPQQPAPAAQINILDSGNKNIASVTQGYQDGWVLKTQKFTATTSTIRLVLGATAFSSGNIYIDDLQITPVLLARDASDYTDASLNQSANIPDLFDRQTCRLYPREDSLSCSYYDSTGILQKGDNGYCLQYDHAPGDPNACILWWPIDKVKGSGVQSATAKGYDQRAPLYYCVGLPPRPYLDVTDMTFNVDEMFEMKVNGKNIIADHGEIGYVNGTVYGKNVISTMYDNGSCKGCAPTCFIGGALGLGCDLSSCLSECAQYYSGSLVDSLASSADNSDINTLNGRKIIYLNYGTNTVQILFQANAAGGRTHFRVAGGKFVNYIWNGNSYAATNTPLDIPGPFQGAPKGGDQVFDVVDVNGGVLTQLDDTGQNPNLPCGVISISPCNNNGYNADPNSNFVVPGDHGTGSFGNFQCEAEKLTCGSNRVTLFYKFNIPQYCGKIADVVTSDGRNKAWTERVRQGSDYNLTCNKNLPLSIVPRVFDSSLDPAGYKNVFAPVDPEPNAANPSLGGTCVSTSALSPFGSVNPPAGDISFLSDPTSWKNPLPYWAPTADAAKASGMMGQLYDKNDLRNLFAQSYGVWNWNGSSYQTALDSENISAITNICPGNKRPSGSGSDTICAVAPTVANINLNGSPTAYLYGRGFVNLTFNSQVDPEQTPLAEYTIDWGDGESLDVSGADMNARPLGTPPHSAYHAYDYYDLLNKSKSADFIGGTTSPSLLCSTDNNGKNYCQVKPRVKIIDNWGWCSEGGIVVGVTSRPCPTITKQGGYCMNASTRAVSGRCWSNANCSNSSFPVCSDGWWEPTGFVIVYKQ